MSSTGSREAAVPIKVELKTDPDYETNTFLNCGTQNFTSVDKTEKFNHPNPTSVKVENYDCPPITAKVEPCDFSSACESDIPLLSHEFKIKKEIDIEEQTNDEKNSLENSWDQQSIIKNTITKLMLEYNKKGFTEWPQVVLTQINSSAKCNKTKRKDIISSINIKYERYYSINENNDLVNPTDPLLDVSHEMMFKGNSLGNPENEDDKTEVLKAIRHMDNEILSDSGDEFSAEVERKMRPKRQKRTNTVEKFGSKKKKKPAETNLKKPSKVKGRKWSFYSDTDIPDPEPDPYEDSGSDNWEPELNVKYLANIEKAMKKAGNNKNNRVWINLDDIYDV